MGLDMYLYKAKKLDGLTANDISNIDGYFSYSNRPVEYKECTPVDWNGLDEDKVKKDFLPFYEAEYIERYYEWDKKKNYPYKSIMQQIASWRKANQVHNWFVKNIQNGIDNCGIYEVSKSQLEDLLDRCKKIKEKCHLVDGKVHNGYRFDGEKEVPIIENGKVMTNINVAEILLPSKDGFFFGSMEYDEYYMMDIDYTIEIIQKILKDTDFEKEMVMYSSSW